ncbi:MAG TPA: 2-isopropylmalate synthase [Planctomycetota bacterium]|nr:2-isopropylmalate synthase [Planctomycetota bacterium]
MSTRAQVSKYVAPAMVDMPDRRWPSKTITSSPQWCSVDLRDGNQALPCPLTPGRKLEYFNLLCKIGFKHIEVAFPSASQDDYEFTRRLIEENLIPRDVFIMGLTQCRPHLVERTLQSLHGIERGIVHAYLATSDLHMQQVFNMNREQALKMAVGAVAQVRDLVAAMKDSDIRLEFSPEEYTDTDLAFALELCEAVFETWGNATPEKPLIFNLPATVERRPPNHYADMIEWFCRRFSARDRILVSVHAHNDQGMAVAATEMALMAGADRVEGTLFGHGERTGNTDLVIVANNLMARGIRSGLDFSKLDSIVETVERLTGLQVYCRQPYAGEYVFTAFSGSHQDAIRKGMQKLGEAPQKFGSGWKVPYLHVDPSDLGRSYERLIRINSQSGKGGVAWVLEQDYGLKLPKPMHPEVGAAVQRYADEVAREVTSEEVHRIFLEEFVDPDGPFELIGYWPRPDDADPTHIHGELKVKIAGEPLRITAEGNGPISAFVHGIQQLGAPDFTVDDYHEQAIGKGADAQAMAYVPLKLQDGSIVFGVGIDTNIDQAAVRAIIAGVNRVSRMPL